MESSDRRTRAYYERTARIHDWLMKVTAWFDRVDARAERAKLIRLAEIRPGDHVLEVGVGTGSNLPPARRAGARSFVGLDLADAMLRQCRHKGAKLDIRLSVVQGQAAHLPLSSNSFDAVLQFGGFRQFRDRARAASEMLRVAKPRATVLISDKSLWRAARRSVWYRTMAYVRSELSQPPPVDSVPVPRQAIQIDWIWGGLVYVIKTRKPA